MSEWQALAAGFAFYLILEGVMPFFNPPSFKRAMAMMIELSDQHLRWVGGAMIFIGIIILFSVK
jgi:uncharacterized protein YjeT (DUF2065 family)